MSLPHQCIPNTPALMVPIACKSNVNTVVKKYQGCLLTITAIPAMTPYKLTNNATVPAMTT